MFLCIVKNAKSCVSAFESFQALTIASTSFVLRIRLAKGTIGLCIVLTFSARSMLSNGKLILFVTPVFSKCTNMFFTFLPNSIFCISIHIRSPEICVKPLTLLFIAFNVSFSQVGFSIRP